MASPKTATRGGPPRPDPSADPGTRSPAPRAAAGFADRSAASATSAGVAPFIAADAAPVLEWSDEPCYVISIAARLVGTHAQTLRYYERAGLVTPARSKGNIRLYRRSDIDRLRLIQRLISELGVNLAGVEVIFRMEARIRALEQELEREPPRPSPRGTIPARPPRRSR